MTMRRFLLSAVALLGLITGGFAADKAFVVTNCTLGTPYTAGLDAPLIQNQSGQLCIEPISAGTGDVVGPASSVDNNVPRFDGVTGKLLQGSLLTLDDDGVGTILGTTLTAPGLYVGITTDTVARVSLGINTTNEPRIGFGPGGASARDVFLTRDAANSLALRNGTNTQNFSVYGTFTDASNYERMRITVSTSGMNISHENAGTGVARAITFGVGGAGRWQFSTAGHLLAVTDNANDIGAAGANRPRVVYAGTFHSNSGTNIDANGDVNILSGRTLGWTSVGGQIASISDGVIMLRNSSNTSFGSLLFGQSGTTFNRIKHDGTGILAVKLADDSAYSDMRARTFDTSGFTVAGLPAAGQAGRTAHVTDQTTGCPLTGAALTGGGAVVCPAFDNGVAWVGGWAYVPGLIEPANDNLPWEERLAA